MRNDDDIIDACILCKAWHIYIIYMNKHAHTYAHFVNHFFTIIKKDNGCYRFVFLPLLGCEGEEEFSFFRLDFLMGAVVWSTLIWVGS